MKWFFRTALLAAVLAIIAGIGWDRVREYFRQQKVQRAHAALARRISLHEFAGDDQSLELVLRKLAKQCDVPIVHAKKPEGLLGWYVDVPDAELPLETALRVILRQCELAAVPYRGQILILRAQDAHLNEYPQLHPLPVSGPEGNLELDWRWLIMKRDEENDNFTGLSDSRSMRLRMQARMTRFGGSLSSTGNDDAISDEVSLLPGALVITDSPENQRRVSMLLRQMAEAASPEGRQLIGTPFAGIPLTDRPIFEALEKPLSVEFDNVPLMEALAKISRVQKVPIFLQCQWLEHHGIQGGWRVTFSAANLPLRKVLEGILVPHELDFYIQDEMIQISASQLGSHPRIGVYDVVDLLALASVDPEELHEQISLHCGTENRGYLGDGLGDIRVLPPGWLVTRQTEGDHFRIARLLAQLRLGLQPRAAPTLEVPAPWPAGEEKRRRNEGDDEPDSLVLDLRGLVQGATERAGQKELQTILDFLDSSKRLTIRPPSLFGHLLIVTDYPPQQEAIKNLIATLVRRRRELRPVTSPIPAEAVTPQWLNLSDKDAALAKRLAEEIDVDLPLQPLQTAVEQLAARFDVKLSLDTKQLDTRQSRVGYPVALKAQGKPLYAAFQDLLHPRQMDFLVRDGQLIITTDERAERQCVHRLYPVRDLLAGPAEMKIEEVIDAINSFSWILDEGQSYGGEAEILAVPGTDLLCVSQTLAGHMRLEKLFNLVRQVQLARGPGPQSAKAIINGITFEAHSAAPLFTGERKFLIPELASYLDEGAGLLSVQGLRRADQQIAILGETVVAQGNSVHLDRVRHLVEYLLRWHDTLPRAAEVFEKRDPAAAEKTLALFSGASDPAERAYLAFLLRFSAPPPRAAWTELAVQLKKLTQHEELGLETPLHEQLSLAMLSWAINPKTSLDELCAECKVNRSPSLQIGILYRMRLLHPQPYNVADNRDDAWIPHEWSQDAKDFARGFKYASDPVLPKFLYDLAKPSAKEPTENQPSPTNRRNIRMPRYWDY